MALTKAKKHQKVAGLAADLQGATAAIIGTFSAMTADKDISLRKTVRDAGGKYSVLKNKLAPKAGAGTQIEGALGGLKGVSSIAYTSGDPVALAKALAGWVKDNSQFTFKLGIVDGQVLDVSEVQALATMPGKEELFSKLLWLINAPAQRLATVINATGRDLAVVINQGVEKEKFAKGADEAPVAAAPEADEAPAVEAAPQIEANTDADPAQPEDGADSQAGAAGDEAPVEGA
jgi:large subunit ribosomal protein L10